MSQAKAWKIGECGPMFCCSGHCFGVLDRDTARKPATVTHAIWGGEKGVVSRRNELVLHATDFLPK